MIVKAVAGISQPVIDHCEFFAKDGGVEVLVFILNTISSLAHMGFPLSTSWCPANKKVLPTLNTIKYPNISRIY